MKRSHAVMLAITVLTCALPLSAARVRRLSLDEIRDRAAVVVVGEVVGSTTRLGQADMVWTDYQVRVTETWKGENQPAIKTISFAGGRFGEYQVGIDGVPELEAGHSYVFFLKDKPGLLPTPTLGWGQGIYRVTETESAGKKQQALVSFDGDPLELNSSGQIRRGRTMQYDGSQAREVQAANSLNRVRPSASIRADGSLGPAPEARSLASVATVRRFASLGQLRDFVAGKIASAERPIR
jgi:hypothetical protein